MLDSPWERDSELDAATAHMSRKSNKTSVQLRNFISTRFGPKVGRNALCPCGSGKKSKRCCAL
jgi:uncharacterized protein YecA (UPF0149 family)